MTWYIAFISFNYWLRGSGLSLFTSKPLTSVYAGIATYYYSNDIAIAVIISLGLYLAVLFGWTLRAISGWPDDRDKFPPVTYYTDQIIEKLKIPNISIKGSGVIWATIRATHFIPLFVGLSYIYGTSALWGLLCLSMGICQYITGLIVTKPSWWIPSYEVFYGAVVGTSLALAVN